MNTSRFVVGAVVLCALPVLAQPELKPVNGLPYPLVSPEDAAKLSLNAQPIKLHLRDVTLDEALKQLQEQSGVALDTSWGGEAALAKKLSLDIETRSFSEAFKAVLDEADVKSTLQRFGGSWQVRFGQTTLDGANESGERPQSGTPSFPIRVLNLRSGFSKTVIPGKNKAAQREQSTTLSVEMQVTPDQQLPVIGSPRILVTRAEDEQGRSLRDETPNPFYLGYDGWMSQPTSVSLRVPQTASQKLAHFEGVASYILSSKRDKWEVADVLNVKNASHVFQSGGQTFTASIENAQKKGAGIRLNFQLKGTLQGAGGFGAMPNPIFSFEQLRTSLYLVDAKGQRLATGGSTGTGGNNEMTLQVDFLPAQQPRHFTVKDGKPAVAPPETPTLNEPIKFVFDTPTEFVQTQVPFSFSDLPLP